MIIFPGPDLGDGTTVVIEGLLIGLDFDGVGWFLDEQPIGWSMGGGVESRSVGRPSQHGSFDVPPLRRARVITLNGTCSADTPELALEANDALAAILADGAMGQMTVWDGVRSRSAQVRVSDTPLDHWLTALTFTWSLQFTAPDWRKYGEQQSADTSLPGGGTGVAYPLTYPLDYGDPGVDGRVTFTNTGKANTEPVFTVNPPLAVGFEITRLETGRRLRYEHPVGSVLTVDCAAGTVLEAGERRERYLTVREWPTVAPGEVATFQFSTLGPETVDDPAHLYLSAAPAYP